MGSNNRANYLKKNIFIFALGNIATKAITFFLVPIYTAVLSTYEYGVVDLTSTVITIAVPVATLNICEAVMRFALDKGADQKKITQVGTNVYLMGCIAGLLVISVCNLFENLSSHSGLIYLYMIAMAGSQLYLCDLRGKELLLQYSIGNILQTLLVAVLNILFLVVFKWGVSGYFAAYAIACFITMIYALVIGLGYKSFRLHRMDISLFKGMAKYAVVLIPNSFMWWIMNSSDRIMVSAMVSVAANGIYAVSYKLPSIVSIATNVFTQAWSYSAIKEEGSKDEANFNNQMLMYLTSISMLVGIGLCTIMKPFLKIYVSEAYYEAWQYTPFLIIGCVYLTLGSFMATSYTVHKDSFGFLFSAMFGALFNVAFNYILIPHIQVYGAAFATCVSYILVFVFRLFHTRKYLKYNIKTKEFIFGTVMLFATSALMFVDNVYGQVIQVLILVASILFYAVSEKALILKIWKGVTGVVHRR